MTTNGKLREKSNLEYMAYSRWIDSKFYTYWAGQANFKEDEVFVVHYDLETYRSFTYTECKQMMDDTLRIKGKMNFIDNDEEAKEIQGYIKQFIESVDHRYLVEIRGGQ
tara:strand:- start:319 stop:645 length:327 start_codon:yes stop_codon:yes gene_type:complete